MLSGNKPFQYNIILQFDKNGAKTKEIILVQFEVDYKVELSTIN